MNTQLAHPVLGMLAETLDMDNVVPQFEQQYPFPWKHASYVVSSPVQVAPTFCIPKLITRVPACSQKYIIQDS